VSFWTPQALGPLAQSESSGNASLIHYPSGYTSSGIRSSASGLYGYLDSTWQTYAGQAGVDTSLYPRAYMAPASVQNQVALITPTSNWTCPGCNATASRLATDPSNVTGSTIAAGPADSASGANSGVGPDSNPLGSSVTQNPSGTSTTSGSGLAGDTGQGAPVTQGLQTGTINAIQTWVTSIENAVGTSFSGALKSGQTAVATWFAGVENWFVRFGLIVLGIILVAIGLVILMWDHGGQQFASRAGAVMAA
jgi:hypothetical protein